MIRGELGLSRGLVFYLALWLIGLGSIWAVTVRLLFVAALRGDGAQVVNVAPAPIFLSIFALWMVFVFESDLRAAARQEDGLLDWFRERAGVLWQRD